ncbi:MAG TPA: hypothetical protein VGX45_03195 [Solirubrobacteraceae bacterium]|nr:hypothetical protein [Solirubrobacteraceae bacterium]
MRARRSLILASLLPLAVVLSACGARGGQSTVADTGAFYVRAGALTYQVQISRALNPYSVEDKGYLAGLPAGTPAPGPNEEWFGVFMWAQNFTQHAHVTVSPASFDIVDTQGNTYYPIQLNPSVNPYAWTSMILQPNDQEPVPNSTAAFGPTGGGELLFKINDTAYSNRPLTLQIRAPGQASPSTVSLDL